jgi:hypothetical protein
MKTARNVTNTMIGKTGNLLRSVAVAAGLAVSSDALAASAAAPAAVSGTPSADASAPATVSSTTAVDAKGNTPVALPSQVVKPAANYDADGEVKNKTGYVAITKGKTKGIQSSLPDVVESYFPRSDFVDLRIWAKGQDFTKTLSEGGYVVDRLKRQADGTLKSVKSGSVVNAESTPLYLEMALKAWNNGRKSSGIPELVKLPEIAADKANFFITSQDKMALCNGIMVEDQHSMYAPLLEIFDPEQRKVFENAQYGSFSWIVRTDKTDGSSIYQFLGRAKQTGDELRITLTEAQAMKIKELARANCEDSLEEVIAPLCEGTQIDGKHKLYKPLMDMLDSKQKKVLGEKGENSYVFESIVESTKRGQPSMVALLGRTVQTGRKVYVPLTQDQVVAVAELAMKTCDETLPPKELEKKIKELKDRLGQKSESTTGFNDSGAVLIPFHEKTVSLGYGGVQVTQTTPRFNGKGLKVGESTKATSLNAVELNADGRFNGVGNFMLPLGLYVGGNGSVQYVFDQSAIGGKGFVEVGTLIKNLGIGARLTAALQKYDKVDLGNGFAASGSQNMLGLGMNVVYVPVNGTELSAFYQTSLSGNAESTVTGPLGPQPTVNSAVSLSELGLGVRQAIGKNVRASVNGNYTDGTQFGTRTTNAGADLRGDWYFHPKIGLYLKGGASTMLEGPKDTKVSTVRYGAGLEARF